MAPGSSNEEGLKIKDSKMLYTPSAMPEMKDAGKSKSELVSELDALRQYVSRLEHREVEHKQME